MSPGRFTQRRVGASGSCSGGRGNVLAVRNCRYVAVCSATRGPSAPMGRGEGRGHIVAAARLQLVVIVIVVINVRLNYYYYPRPPHGRERRSSGTDTVDPSVRLSLWYMYCRDD